MHPKQFLKDWFAKHNAKEQARLAQVRKLVGADQPKYLLKVPATVVKFPIKVKWAFRKIDEVHPLKKDTVEGSSVFSGGRMFKQALKKRGFVELGSGAYGTVLQHPKSDKVLKVIHRPHSDGWPAYVKWATETGYAGTFAPLVYSYKYIAKGGFAIASMEKLDATVEDAGWKSDLYAKYGVFSSAVNMTNEQEGLSNEMMKKLCETAEPGLAKFTEDFVKKFGGSNDLHHGNVMSRKGQLVVTDPLSFYPYPEAGQLRWKKKMLLAA